MVGWGTTDTLDVSQFLQKANMIIHDDEACFGKGAQFEVSSKRFRDHFLCVGGQAEGTWSPSRSPLSQFSLGQSANSFFFLNFFTNKYL